MRLIRLSSLFLFGFSFAKALMGPRFFVHLKLMHWGVESKTHAVLRVNVHPNMNSHTKGLQNKDGILGSTTSRWMITSAAFKSKQSDTKELLCCVSERLWLLWKRQPNSDSWQFRAQGPLLWADTPHRDHFSDPEKQPGLKIKRQKVQE